MRCAVGAEDRQRVGQVDLALGVVGRDPAQGVDHRAAGEGVDAGVDLLDRELLVGGVAGGLGLDHALHAAVAVANDAAVAGGVVEDHRGHRRRRAVGGVGLRERLDRLGGDERDVAADDDDAVGRGDLAGGGEDGVAGAARLLLDGERGAVGQQRLDRAVGAADDHDLARPGGQGGVDRPADQGLPAEVVQSLGHLRLHPRALPRGEDDDDGTGHVRAIVAPSGSTDRPRTLARLCVRLPRPRLVRRPRCAGGATGSCASGYCCSRWPRCCSCRST